MATPKLTSVLLRQLAEDALATLAPTDFAASEAELEADAALETDADEAPESASELEAEFADHEAADQVADAPGADASSAVFVVEAGVSDSPIRPKARIVLDGDAGVDIATCAAVSRRVNRRLEELLGEEASYVLEVTSPGADQPLTLPRQFPRHVGRTLTVTKTDGTTLTGVLREATPAGIALTGPPPKRGKYKMSAAEVAAAQPIQPLIPFNEIKSAVIVLSFS